MNVYIYGEYDVRLGSAARSNSFTSRSFIAFGLSRYTGEATVSDEPVRSSEQRRQRTVMTCMRNHIHPAKAISGLTHAFDRLLSAFRVHPIMIAVCNTSQDVNRERWSRKNSQTKVTGIFRACTRSTSGLRACAPGARRCAV